MSKAKIRLITRGDDSGSCHSANVAIKEAFEKGILRNTSLMVPCEGFREAAEMLAGLKGLCVGLHATLNAEWNTVRWGPVLPGEQVPTLVDANGHFHQTTQALHHAGADAAQAVAEIRAQLNKARGAGFDIRYLDTHMGFSWINGIDDAMADLARTEGLIYHPEGLSRLPKVEGAFSDPVERLISQLRQAEPGTYLYVNHPGCDNEEMRQFIHPGLGVGQVAREREQDRRLWCDQRLMNFCREHGVQPIRFTEL